MAPFSRPVGITAVRELPLVVTMHHVSQGYGSQEENPGLEVSGRLENRGCWESGSSRNNEQVAARKRNFPVQDFRGRAVPGS